MAQVPTINGPDGNAVDYTPAAAVTGGDVVVQGGLVGVATTDIAASDLGSLSVSGLKFVPKTTAAWTVGLPVHWNASGDPDSGTAGTGAANQLGVGVYMGVAAVAASSGDDRGYVLLNLPSSSGVGASSSVTPTVGGGTTGLIPVNAGFVTVINGADANSQISLPAGTVGDEIRILVGTTGCELISAVAADKVNEVTVGATNELALTAEALYRCQYTKSGFWIVTGQTKLGAAQAALVPDAL
jgi:predicted RecA/RadA family phage recombinase